MDKVMMIYGGEYYFWKPIILVAGAIAAAILAVGVRIWRGEKMLPLLAALPIGAFLSVYIARLIHWYCRFESYESLSAALRQLRGGGYSLIGVFAGMLIAFLLIRAFCLTRDLPSLLDCAAPAAALGIAVGRLGDFFTSADRAKMMVEDAAMQRLPFASAVVNSTSGATEWRYATFAIQSAWCALLCVIFLVAALAGKRKKPLFRESWGHGNVFFLFMVLYCCGQIVTDSTRYDALFLRSNGFVSLEQIVCGVAVFAVLVLYSVRSIQVNRFRFWHPILWVLSLCGLGLAGYMEYYVQRHGNEYIKAYGLMCLGLLVFFAVVFAMFRTTMKAEQAEKAEKPQKAAPARKPGGAHSA